ncbi:MAG: dihydropteroate synthase [Cyclobacteriaceae bacterium]|nr:dihydropteroate synthase [Cyclobacteriaceae bacterium]
MGILNITPDSFYDGGKYQSEAAILKHAEKMLLEGASFLDVGGYSSRPGADDVSTSEESNRVIPAIRSLAKEFPQAIISIDTFRSNVAKASVEEGAGIINDISGGELDPAMFETVAALNVPYILMHMRGNPKSMRALTTYNNLVKEVLDYFAEKISQLQLLGVKDIIIDPGFGFAKTREQSFELLHHLQHLQILGKPILAGLSRKSMIWKSLTIAPEDALNGTTSLNTIALLKGANILRVHDVKAAMEIIKLNNVLNQA